MGELAQPREPHPSAEADCERLDDESFLDELFDRAVELAAAGTLAQLDPLARSRPHLRERIEDTLRVARGIAVQIPPSVPSIAGYRILRELGAGSMGQVFLAQQEALGARLVALKVLPAASALSRRARERFLAEARALARMRHANIVAIHDVVEADDLCAYAMEWIDGQSLAELIDRQRTARGTHGVLDQRLAIDPANWTPFVARVGIQIAHALETVHAAGLVHRDVKPSNVLLRGDGTALLSDFGLVRDPEASLHTLTGDFVGTLAFAAPEALRGEHARIDPRSDVFSLGATLYQALSFQLPFGSSSPALVQQRASAGNFAPLRKLDSKLPRDLETIVAKALEPDPQRRYASAAALADDLERLLALRPILAKPAGVLERGIKRMRRDARALWGTAAGLLIGVAAAAALAWWLYDRAQDPARARSLLMQARLELIRTISNKGFLGLYGHGTTTDPLTFEMSGASPTMLERALALYDRSLALDDRPLEARIERDIVSCIAEHQESGARHLELTDFLARECPAVNRGVRAAQASQPLFRAEVLADARPHDRKALGLYGFIADNAPLVLEAWGDLDLARESDALIEGLLGNAYLLTGRHELAYVRLMRALDEYPDSAQLGVAVADVALQLGDLAVARRLLARCDRGQFDRSDSSYERVAGDLEWAAGNVAEAERLYHASSRSDASAGGPNPLINLRLAHLAEQRGDFQRAWRKHLTNARGWPPWSEPREGMLRVSELWWSGLDESARRAAIVAAAQDAPGWPAAWSATPAAAGDATPHELLSCGLLVPLLCDLREHPTAWRPLVASGAPFLHRSLEAGTAREPEPGGVRLRDLAVVSELVGQRGAAWRAALRPVREATLLAAYALDRTRSTDTGRAHARLASAAALAGGIAAFARAVSLALPGGR